MKLLLLPCLYEVGVGAWQRSFILNAVNQPKGRKLNPVEYLPYPCRRLFLAPLLKEETEEMEEMEEDWG